MNTKNDKQPPLLTKKGYESLKDKLKTLEEEKRPKVVERLKRARSYGDLSENQEYKDSREELELMDTKIQEIKSIINTAEIVKNNGDKSIVGIGSEVVVDVNGNEITFKVVGDWEANPEEKRVSSSSPIGKALLGKKEGDDVEVDAPAGKVTYKIKRIQ